MICAVTTIASTAQTLTTLISFNGNDGDNPSAALVQGNDGSFYGTTYQGGAHGNYRGTVFKMTPQGDLTVLYTFCSQSGCTDGAFPYVGLVRGNDGNFYGTTANGGSSTACANGCGTVFKITPQGALTTLHSFDNTDGSIPLGALIQATDGNFYGTTRYGGTAFNCSDLQPVGCGTVFKITPTGTLTTIHSFNLSDGDGPYAALLQAANGNFYGTTGEGVVAGDVCSLGCGTVFEMTLSGTVTTLHVFQGSDGSFPSAPLIQGSNSNFYGTTSHGGSSSNCNSGCGTTFIITPQGAFTSVSFNGGNGSDPSSPLLQGIDGNLYGTTTMGGMHNAGEVFKITPEGMLTVVYSFCSQAGCADGSDPEDGLLQLPNGTFYATAFGGGAFGAGTVFSLSMGGSNPIQLIPVTPCRLVDTRGANGPFGGPPITGGTVRNFPIPQGPCAIPANAAAFALNVTVVPMGRLGYLTIWPQGEQQPLGSLMNSPDGRNKANAAIVPAGVDAGVSVYVTDTTNLIIDIDGYFAPASSSSLAFYSLPPCRIVDTRQQNGDLGAPFLQANQERDFPILESSCVPAGLTPAAYSFNVTAVPHPAHQRLGFLTVWPVGEDQPVVSTLNNPTGTNVANAAIVPAGTGGAIAVFPNNNTDLLIDVNGYFAPAGAGGLSLYPTAPCRVIDTRSVGSGQPFMGELTVNVINTPCSPPANAQAYVFNATVVPPGGLGYLTLWPDGEVQPVVSTLNAIDGSITSNMAIVPTNNGSIDAYASALTQLILDISSYFAP